MLRQPSDKQLTLFCSLALTIVVSALLFRLASLGLYPLMDTSEARYGEMVRLMVTTNQWLVPYFDDNIPFMGKPPLFIWLSAVSVTIFGLNEWAIRLPSLCCSVLTLLIVWKLARFQRGTLQAHIAVLMLTSSAAFLVLSGALLADSVMTTAITLILASFWIGWHSDCPRQAVRWQYLFFIGCGIAVLTKGPAALVLAAGPIFLWCLSGKRLVTFWRRFPWGRGLSMTSVVALPWFIVAELKHPGLIEYLVWGEHISRYLESGWQGDQYGNAHVHPLGAIWGYLLLGAFPWSFILVGCALLSLRNISFRNRLARKNAAMLSSWTRFLLCWSLFLPVFFTFTHNLIWTYVLPVLPALALLTADLACRRPAATRLRKLTLSTISPILMVIAVIILMNDGGKKSHKYLLKHLEFDTQHETQGQIIYFQKRPFSARFYSDGAAKLANNRQDILRLMVDGKTDALATRHDQFHQLPASLRQQFKKKAHYRDWTLWIERHH